MGILHIAWNGCVCAWNRFDDKKGKSVRWHMRSSEIQGVRHGGLAADLRWNKA